MSNREPDLRKSASEYPWFLLAAGFFVLLVAGSLFRGIAEDVLRQEAIVRLDTRFETWLHVHATPALTGAMFLVSNVHGTVGILVLTLLLGWILFRRHERFWLVALAVAVPGGALLNLLLKQIFQRARPIFDPPLLTLATYGFPSGHAAAATVFYGLLASFVISKVQGVGRRLLIAGAAALLVALVAFSRIYLGVHYLSDVLGGIAEGIAWLALCLTGLLLFRQWEVRRVHR